MQKSQLIRIIVGLLETERDLKFLFSLKEEDLIILTACIRDRVESNNSN